MNLKLKFLKPYSDAVGKTDLDLELKRPTDVDGLLKTLVAQYPKLEKEVYGKDGKPTEYLSLFLNSEPLTEENWLKKKLKDGDEIIFFFPVSGG